MSDTKTTMSRPTYKGNIETLQSGLSLNNGAPAIDGDVPPAATPHPTPAPASTEEESTFTVHNIDISTNIALIEAYTPTELRSFTANGSLTTSCTLD